MCETADNCLLCCSLPRAGAKCLGRSWNIALQNQRVCPFALNLHWKSYTAICKTGNSCHRTIKCVHNSPGLIFRWNISYVVTVSQWKWMFSVKYDEGGGQQIELLPFFLARWSRSVKWIRLWLCHEQEEESVCRTGCNSQHSSGTCVRVSSYRWTQRQCIRLI